MPIINKPTGSGERFIILNAVTKNGWVDGAQLVFKAKKSSGDYQCWGVMKQYMAQHCDFTLNGLCKNLEIAWTKVTPETMDGIMRKVTYWENYHFEQDSLLDSIDDKYGL